MGRRIHVGGKLDAYLTAHKTLTDREAATDKKLFVLVSYAPPVKGARLGTSAFWKFIAPSLAERLKQLAQTPGVQQGLDAIRQKIGSVGSQRRLNDWVLRPGGKPLGDRVGNTSARDVGGGNRVAKDIFRTLAIFQQGPSKTIKTGTTGRRKGLMVRIPGGDITYRPKATSTKRPTIDFRFEGKLTKYRF